MATPVGSRHRSPISCYRVRSWCHQWLSFWPEESERVRFLSCEGASSCRIILQPWDDGFYKLQVCRKNIQNCTAHRTAAEENFDEIRRDSAYDEENLLCPDRRKALNSEEIRFRDAKEKLWFLYHRDSAVGITTEASNEEELLFSLEFDEHGRVRIRGGRASGYLTADSRGRLWSGTQKAQKWEHFTLVEEALDELLVDPTWIASAPVRVTLQAQTGKYLCGAMPVIGANAEAACCCEEFLLDLKFPALLTSRSRNRSSTKSASKITMQSDATVHRNAGPEEKGSICTIRTADGKRMLSAEPDGILFATKVDQVYGMEKFVLELHDHKGCPTVNIRRCLTDVCKEWKYGEHLSVGSAGEIHCSRGENKNLGTLTLSLANGSRVLIRSIHGGFLAHDPFAVPDSHIELNARHRGGLIEQFNRGQRLLCTCLLQTKEGMMELGAWQLKSHGDSLYTVVAMPMSKGGGQTYLCVDSKGCIFQSSEPGVHFPAAASLFEIIPVSGACLDTMDEDICSFSGIVGFTIRTARRIHGQQRYLSVEPSGKVFASRGRPSRWEIFHLIDVDATASLAAPDNFSCLPAAVNLSSPASLNSWHSGLRSQQRVASLGGYGGLGFGRRAAFLPPGLGAAGPIEAASLTSPVASVAAAEALKRACGATAEAVQKGLAVPKRMPATLQDLCITHIGWFASVESTHSQHPSMELPTGPRCSDNCDMEPTSLQTSLVDPELVGLVAVLNSNAREGRIPAELVDGNSFDIPDDLLSRIWVHWRSRQEPQQSCKWWPSALLSQVPPQYHNGLRPVQNHGGRLHGNPVAQQRLPDPNFALWGNSGEGWHCLSCDTGGILAMDPTVNPAHHRYLDVQHRAFSAARQPTGALWNAISFAGVSLMTTTLACRVISFCRVATSAQ